MATELIIEQDADLNRHVLDMTPITWRQRREWMKQGLCLVPFWFLWLVFRLAGRWMEDQPSSWLLHLAGFLSLALLGCLGVMAILDWLDRREKRSSRKISIDKKQITLYPCRTLPWRFIHSWHLAPLAENPILQKLTVVYLPYAKARYTRQWSMVVTDPAQADALRESLRQRAQAGQPGAALLDELPAPEPIPFPSIFIGMSCLALGMMIVGLSAMIMFIGMIFLLLFNLPVHSGLFQSPEEGNRNLIELFSTFAGLFQSHSTYELGWALITAGGFLLLPALALFKLGDLQLSRKPAS